MDILDNFQITRGIINTRQYSEETKDDDIKIGMTVFGIDSVEIGNNIIPDRDSCMQIICEKDSRRISAVVMDNDRYPNLQISVNCIGDVTIYNPCKNYGGIVEFPRLLPEKDAQTLKIALKQAEEEDKHINGFMGGKDPDFFPTGGQWHLYLYDGEPLYSWNYKNTNSI